MASQLWLSVVGSKENIIQSHRSSNPPVGGECGTTDQRWPGPAPTGDPPKVRPSGLREGKAKGRGREGEVRSKLHDRPEGPTPQ